MYNFLLNAPFAHGGPLGCADFRTEPEDFVVDEELGFQLSGEGEHLFLHIRKRNQNTRWVADQLAAVAGIKPVDVGFSGMKDRRAVTSQWFSLYLPRQELNPGAVETIEGVELLAVARHNRKLRRGEHAANRFDIRLRNCTALHTELDQRLTLICDVGVPNYFGEQRFGREGSNLAEFARLFVGQSGDARNRNRQRGRKGNRQGGDTGIYLSAARSYLFNRILGLRVEQDSWNRPLPGEQTVTGALWGRGRSQVTEQVVALEQQIAATLPGWCDALEHSGLAQQRRSLVLQPRGLSWRFEGDDLAVQFRLPPGCFATSILRELTTLRPRHGIVAVLNNDAENSSKST